MNARWRWLQGLVALAVLAIAAAVLWREAQSISIEQLHAAWRRTPGSAIALSAGLSAISLSCLALYEWFATRCVVPGRVPAGSALRIGALSHAIANTLGFHAVTGVALRTYFYRRFGLSLTDVTRVVAVVALCVGSGVVLVSASALVQLGPAVWGGAAIAAPLGVALLLVALGVLAWRRRRARGAARIPVRQALGMLLVSWIEMSAAIAALYVLLPVSSAIAAAPFVVLFVGAMLFGLLSHVPGSVGVFEAAILAGLPGADPASVLLALLAYRLIYNVLPFLIALVLLAIDVLRSRARARSVRRRI